jgi:hypothetical protein
MDLSNVPVSPWPYGEWKTSDGSLVLFNRSYSPLWIKHPDGSVERADPKAWIKGIVKQEFFWWDHEHPDRCPKTKCKLDRFLKSWGSPDETLPLPLS